MDIIENVTTFEILQEAMSSYYLFFKLLGKFSNCVYSLMYKEKVIIFLLI